MVLKKKEQNLLHKKMQKNYYTSNKNKNKTKMKKKTEHTQQVLT